MQLTLRNILTAFFAGALAVLFFHQTVIFIFHLYGLVPFKPWGNALNPWGVPAIINSMFWGGVWGLVYLLISNKFPKTWSWWLKGAVFGLLGPMLFGFIVMAYIRNQPMFQGGNVMRIFMSAGIQIAFGIGMVWFTRFIASRSNALDR